MASRFWKYQALGNDYIVLDPRETALVPSGEIARRLCDRHRGIGGDGVLVGPVAAAHGFGLRIFNPDGSEAEKSGNGIRIFCKYLSDAGYLQGSSLVVSTSAGPARCELLEGDATQVRVDMGRAVFDSDAIAAAGERREMPAQTLQIDNRTVYFHAVSLGNPHCVVPVSEATREAVCELGPRIEVHPNFPARTNVQILEVLDRHRIRIEIWERGAGYTLASGSSSCAAASVARRLGWVDSPVEVVMPGGCVEVAFDDSTVWLTGAVAAVFSGAISPALERELLQL